MASLYIKDQDAAADVARLARRLGTTKTEIIRRGIRALEAEVGPDTSPPDFSERLARYRREHPLPPRLGPPPEKVFYDWLSGEEDAHDPVR